jgi:hypothetical protein
MLDARTTPRVCHSIPTSFHPVGEDCCKHVDVDTDDDDNKNNNKDKGELFIPVDMRRSIAVKHRCLGSTMILILRPTHIATLYQAQGQTMEISRSS